MSWTRDRDVCTLGLYRMSTPRHERIKLHWAEWLWWRLRYSPKGDFDRCLD